MAEKKFYLKAKDIRELAPGRGGCIATDKIVVDGLPVSFMDRHPPHNELDSGWWLTSGYESDEYMSDASNQGVYDVNTIANYDPSIIPFLDAPVGSSFGRENPGDELKPIEYRPLED